MLCLFTIKNSVLIVSKLYIDPSRSVGEGVREEKEEGDSESKGSDIERARPRSVWRLTWVVWRLTSGAWRFTRVAWGLTLWRVALGSWWRGNLLASRSA